MLLFREGKGRTNESLPRSTASIVSSVYEFDDSDNDMPLTSASKFSSTTNKVSAVSTSSSKGHSTAKKVYPPSKPSSTARGSTVSTAPQLSRRQEKAPKQHKPPRSSASSNMSVAGTVAAVSEASASTAENGVPIQLATNSAPAELYPGPAVASHPSSPTRIRLISNPLPLRQPLDKPSSAEFERFKSALEPLAKFLDAQTTASDAVEDLEKQLHMLAEEEILYKAAKKGLFDVAREIQNQHNKVANKSGFRTVVTRDQKNVAAASRDILEVGKTLQAHRKRAILKRKRLQEEMELYKA